MNFNNQKIDDEVCKNLHLIENQDLLLSSNMNEHDLGIDFFSMMENDLIPNESSALDMQQQSESLGCKDDIIDSDLFEILRSEDPDVVSLIESLSNGSDPKTFFLDFLPQVSVNTANKILNETAQQTQQEPQPTKFSIVSLDDGFKKESVTPPPANSQQLVPSRVSQRLIKRRGNGQLGKKKDVMLTTKPKREMKRLNHKRKRSVDEDGSESGSVFSTDSSNDNNTFKSIDTSVGN